MRPDPTSVRQNILANFAGRAWSALMVLAFLPLYVRFLGVESYGLVGVYASLLGLFAVLDLGLGTTLSRELARLPEDPGGAAEARDLARTLELVYWGVGAAIGVVVAAAAPLIAHHWIDARGIGKETTQHAIVLMGLAIALQWPVGLYAGGLLGLQRQVLLNVVRIVASTLQAGGAVLVLWLWSPTILAYFGWHMFAGVLFSGALAWHLWRSLPAGGAAAFRRPLLAKHWRFAGGVTGIAALVAVLSQVDKLILSRMLALEAFGYYALATAIAAALSYLSGPIFAALFPRFSQALAAASSAELERLYHRGCQLMALVVLPVAVYAALFSRELLLAWFGAGAIAEQTHRLVSLLVAGGALNALAALPYGLQLAAGWTGLLLKTNLVATLCFVPLVIALTARLGAEGAALAWIALNASYLVVLVPLMHRRLLPQALPRWYLEDVGVPAALSLALGIASRMMMPADLAPAASLAWIALGLAATAACAALAMPHTRAWVGELAARRAG